MSLYTSKELFTLQLQETPITPQETNQDPEKPDPNQGPLIDTFNPMVIKKPLIKMIQEKTEASQIEEENNLNKIKEIESTLKISERLTHDNRDIRKNACKELAEMCVEDFESPDDKNEFYEVFSPWVKYCIQEPNAYVLPEALNYFLSFNITFPEQKSSSINDFFNNLDRIVSIGISSLNEFCKKIFFLYVSDKKLLNQSFHKTIEFLNNGSLRLLKFFNVIFEELIQNNVLSENMVKILFEKLVHIYNSNVKNTEKKKAYTKLLASIYEVLDDDINRIKANIHIISIKDFENSIGKVSKKEIKYRLYPKLENENNNSSRLNTETNNNGSFVEPPEKTNNNVVDEKKIPEEVSDVTSLLPSEFFEYHFITQFQTKLETLENANRILSKVKFIKEKDKNLTDIYKVINLSIDDSTILIHLEGIKILGNICRLFQEEVNTNKLKQLLECSFGCFKDRKNLVKNELFNLFDCVIENNCLPAENFISIAISYCLAQKSIADTVKQNVLEYLKLLLKSSKESLKKKCKKISDRSYINYVKSIVELIGNESSSTIKDCCSDLMVVIKPRVDIDTFRDLTKNLPNYRKKILEGGKETNNVVQTESSYRKNLKKIKSSYSFSRNSSRSVNKDRKDLNRSFRGNSTPKKDNLKSDQALIKRVNSSKKLNTGITNNLKCVKKASKGKEGETKKTKDEKEKSPQNVKKKIEKKKEESKQNDVSQESKSNEEESKEDNLREEPREESQSESMISKQSQKEKKMEKLEQKKDDVLSHIESQDKKSLESYSRAIVRDFLIFVDRVSSGELHEDLSVHFKVIFNILEKILQRMKELTDDKMTLDILIERITKIVVLVPCISQIEGSGEFDKTLFKNFLSTIKESSSSKEKFYINLFTYSIKYSQHTKGFLKMFDLKPSILFFLNYLHKGYEETKSEEIAEVVNVFLEETKLIPDDDKEVFAIKVPKKENSMTQNIDDYEEEEGEKNNLIIINNVSKIEPVEQSEVDVNNSTLRNISAVEPKEPLLNKDNNKDYNTESLKNEKIDTEKLPTEKLYTDNDDDFLQRKIRETQMLINQKALENEKLKEKIKQYEQKKQKHSLNIDSEPSNTNPNSAIPTTTPSAQSGNSDSFTINSLREKINKTNSQKDNILKIKEKLNQTTKKLGLTLQKMVNQTETKEKEKNSFQITSSPIPKSQQDVSKEDLSLQNTIVKQLNTVSNINALNEMISIPHSTSDNSYKQLIKRMADVLEGKIVDENIFQNLISNYRKLATNEQKFDFIKFLRGNLDDPGFIGGIQLNLFLQLYEFLLTILSVEILLHSKEQNVIIHLQQTAETLKKYRNLTDMIKVMLFLLRKYFPKNLNDKLTDTSLVMIKVIIYLIKELIKSLNFQPPVDQKEIYSEINDLFVVTPPSSLKVSTPNAQLYQTIFTVLKSLTDEIAKQSKLNLLAAISYIMQNKIVCDEYINYLQKLSKIN